MAEQLPVHEEAFNADVARMTAVLWDAVEIEGSKRNAANNGAYGDGIIDSRVGDYCKEIVQKQIFPDYDRNSERYKAMSRQARRDFREIKALLSIVNFDGIFAYIAFEEM
jgi:hypothetical protein